MSKYSMGDTRGERLFKIGYLRYFGGKPVTGETKRAFKSYKRFGEKALVPKLLKTMGGK